MQIGSDELSGTDFSLCSYTTKYLREVGVDRKVQMYSMKLETNRHRLKSVPHVRFGETGTRMLTSI